MNVVNVTPTAEDLSSEGKMWRPANWSSLVIAGKAYSVNDIYEAGADAMLEALRAERSWKFANK